MAIGKYSPTIMCSYKSDPDWFVKNGGGFNNGIDPQSDFDNDGFDSYGYNKTGEDRAGNTEDDYQNTVTYEMESPYYYLFEKVYKDWLQKNII